MSRCSYTKHCSLLAPCCGNVVCCHRCHDKAYDHRLPRQQLQTIVCTSCNTTQALAYGNTCLTCGTRFAAYFCTQCGTANNNVPPQGYFHCAACGICRVGRRDEFFHCDGCNCCLRREVQQDHICRGNCLEGPCPICLAGPLSDSQSPAQKLPCGHMAHMACIQSTDLALNSICTACSGSSAAAAAYCDDDEAYAAFHTATATTSSSSRPVSGLIRDLLDLMRPEAALGLSEAELLPMLQELEQQQLLPAREVRFLSESQIKRNNDDIITLSTHPLQFRQHLEAALIKSVLITAPETEAKGLLIDAVVQMLLQGTSGSSNALQLRGRPVSIDRVAVAGSVGKSVTVQGQWDVDLVAFVNLPETLDIVRSIDLLKPEVTNRSWWMADLQQQLCRLLQQQLQRGSSSRLRCIEPSRIGRAAVTFSVTVRTAEAERELSFDILLAPNFAAGAGAAAAAAVDIVRTCFTVIRGPQTPTQKQTAAVLFPVLAVTVLDRAGRYQVPALEPSFLRNVWLSEVATEFVKDAAVAAAGDGMSGRVVTSTIRLVKAWVRKGLQQQPGMGSYKRLKSFQIELLVLHAAEMLWNKVLRSETPRAAVGCGGSFGYGGRYVLDLLLLVLAVAQDWAAAAAAASEPGCDRTPVLFTELARERYYSRQEALACKDLRLWRSSSSSSSSSGGGLGQPLVIHPVDPTCSVFDQVRGPPFELWREFGQAAGQLQQQLLSCSWGAIKADSSLRAVLAGV